MLSPDLNENQLQALRGEWEAQHAAATLKIKELESGLGQALLTGQGQAARADLKAAHNQVNDANLALAEIDRLLPIARVRSLRLQAEGCRKRADQLTKESEALTTKIAALLDKIEALDGCRYVAPRPASKFAESPSTVARLHAQIFRLTEQAEFLELQAQDLLGSKKERVFQWTA